MSLTIYLFIYVTLCKWNKQIKNVCCLFVVVMVVLMIMVRVIVMVILSVTLTGIGSVVIVEVTLVLTVSKPIVIIHTQKKQLGVHLLMLSLGTAVAQESCSKW